MRIIKTQFRPGKIFSKDPCSMTIQHLKDAGILLDGPDNADYAEAEYHSDTGIMILKYDNAQNATNVMQVIEDYTKDDRKFRV